MFKRVLAILLLAMLTFSSVTYATDILASGRQVRGGPGQNNKLYAEPFTLQKDGVLTSIVNDMGAYGFFIIRYDRQGTIVYNTYSSTAAIGRKFAQGTYLIYPNLRDDYNDVTITVRFTY